MVVLSLQLGAKHDVIAERVEASDEPLGRAVLVDAVEVVAAEIGAARSTVFGWKKDNPEYRLSL